VRRWAVFALLVLASALVVAESFDPNLGSEIDSYLTGKNSPIAGNGSVFFSSGNTYDVDPRLIVGIAGAESSFGTNWGACPPSGYNAWSWFWSHTGCATSPFSSYAEGISVVTKGIRRGYLDKGYTTIGLIGAHYCASGCQGWVGNVTHPYLDLHGDADYGADGTIQNLTFSNGQPTSTSVIQSNLQSDGSYASTLSWTFGYEQSLNRTVSVAFPFTPTTTASLNMIDVGLAPQNQGGTVTVELHADSSGAPGNLLESWSSTMPQSGTSAAPLTRLTSVQHPLLSSLSTYWIVATSSSNGGSGGWYTVVGDYTLINRSVNQGAWSSAKTLRGAIRVFGN
jgi:hypothetical protein